MPHLRLEYTPQVDSHQLKALFGDLHNCLYETAKINLPNCKSRAIKIDQPMIGDATDHSDLQFVHLDLAFLEGRSHELKHEIATRFMSLLKNHFNVNDDKTHVTLEIRDIKRDSYFKWPEGTLSQP